MQRPQRSATSLPRAAAENLCMCAVAAVTIRPASVDDLEAIAAIYNQGIADRIATLETEPKSRDDIEDWWRDRGARHSVLVAVSADSVIGWASLNRFSSRCAHTEIADVSVYVERRSRARGVGFALLSELASEAERNGFRKLVLHALDSNEPGKKLYRKVGFREVGVFREHGRIDDAYIDVVAMERLLVGPTAELGRFGQGWI